MVDLLPRGLSINLESARQDLFNSLTEMALSLAGAQTIQDACSVVNQTASFLSIWSGFGIINPNEEMIIHDSFINGTRWDPTLLSEHWKSGFNSTQIWTPK